MEPKKSLGQNFLKNPSIAAAVADGAGVIAGDTVIEVGPGTGMLTEALLARGARVIAIEKDRRLLAPLSVHFREDIAAKKLTLIEGDALTESFSTLADGPYKIAANIPYYITGELIRKITGEKQLPVQAALMIQKEVAERIVAREGKESILSIAVKVFAHPKMVRIVPRGAFQPIPNVDSAILALEKFHNPFADKKEEEKFFSFLKTGFHHRRKLLVRNLEEVAKPTDIQRAFSACKLPLNVRSENLSVDGWKCLAQKL